MNKDVVPHAYAITLVDGDGVTLVGAPLVAEVEAGGIAAVAATLRAAPGGPSMRNVYLRVAAKEDDRQVREEESRFFSPAPGTTR